jgi:hypothetical protein
MLPAGVQLSVAVAKPVWLGLLDAPQRTEVFGGHVITGGVVSSTVIVCVQVPILPHASVAL